MNDLPELIPCKYCGKMIYPGRNRKRKFCNPAEKQAAYRNRKENENAQVLAVTPNSERNEPTVTN